jgi:hypothetical protein
VGVAGGPETFFVADRKLEFAGGWAQQPNSISTATMTIEGLDGTDQQAPFTVAAPQGMVASPECKSRLWLDAMYKQHAILTTRIDESDDCWNAQQALVGEDTPPSTLLWLDTETGATSWVPSSASWLHERWCAFAGETATVCIDRPRATSYEAGLPPVNVVKFDTGSSAPGAFAGPAVTTSLGELTTAAGAGIVDVFPSPSKSRAQVTFVRGGDGGVFVGGEVRAVLNEQLAPDAQVVWVAKLRDDLTGLAWVEAIPGPPGRIRRLSGLSRTTALHRGADLVVATMVGPEDFDGEHWLELVLMDVMDPSQQHGVRTVVIGDKQHVGPLAGPPDLASAGDQLLISWEGALGASSQTVLLNALGQVELIRAAPSGLLRGTPTSRWAIREGGLGGDEVRLLSPWGHRSCEDAGVCATKSYTDCDDGNPCTKNLCEPDTGCANPPFEDGTPCGYEDGAVRTCAGGVCQL